MINILPTQVFEVTQRDRFLLLGCDGFFGVFNPEDAAALTAKLLQEEGRGAKSVCDKLINEVVICVLYCVIDMCILFFVF